MISSMINPSNLKNDNEKSHQQKNVDTETKHSYYISNTIQLSLQTKRFIDIANKTTPTTQRTIR